MSLSIAVALASVGPSLIVILLFCAQYYHPYTDALISLQDVDPVAPQLTRPGRVSRIAIKPNMPFKAGDVLFEVDRVDQAKTQLSDAEHDSTQTKVLAPSDGFVTNLQLRKGMMVGGGATSSVMSFVRERDKEKHGIVVATFTEKNYLMIEPGQYSEVALDGYPGQIFNGHVLNAIDVSGAGQLSATGLLSTELVSGKPSSFAVRIQLDDADQLRLPGGAQGQAAVYTSHAQVAGIPIVFLIRAKSWMKYLF